MTKFLEISDEIQKQFNVYGFYPTLCIQDVAFSDIQGHVVDYSWGIK